MRKILELFLNQSPDMLREIVVLWPKSVVTTVRHEPPRSFSMSIFSHHTDVSNTGRCLNVEQDSGIDTLRTQLPLAT